MAQLRRILHVLSAQLLQPRLAAGSQTAEVVIPYGRGLDVPAPVACHVAAYAQEAPRPTSLGRLLTTLAGERRFTIVDAEYRATLRDQMERVAAIEEWFDARHVESFPVCVAGFWNTTSAGTRVPFWRRWFRLPAIP
jgi:hypothetical protein